MAAAESVASDYHRTSKFDFDIYNSYEHEAKTVVEAEQYPLQSEDRDINIHSDISSNLQDKMCQVEDKKIYDEIPFVSTNTDNPRNAGLSFCCLTIHRKRTVKKWPPKYTKLNLCLGITVFITFSFDYATDVRLMMEYIAEEKYFLFFLTCGFIVIPSLISGIISIVWYSMTYVRDQKLGYNHAGILYIARIIVSFLQLGRLFRQAEFIYCVFRSLQLQKENVEVFKAQQLRKRASEEKRDAATLALIDGFMESALQLVLQLYLTISLQLPATFSRVSSLLSSWISTAVIVTSYYRSTRKAQEFRQNVDFFSAVFYFLWRFTGLGPRYLLLATALTYFQPWCFILIPVHTVFVFLLYLCNDNSRDDMHQIKRDADKSNGVESKSAPKPDVDIGHNRGRSCMKYVLVFLMSFVGIFTFINIGEGGSWKTNCIYYILYYTENILTAVVFLFMSDTNEIMHEWSYALVALPVGLVCHVVSGALYYGCFHPKRWNENAVRIEFHCSCC